MVKIASNIDEGDGTGANVRFHERVTEPLTPDWGIKCEIKMGASVGPSMGIDNVDANLLDRTNGKYATP